MTYAHGKAGYPWVRPGEQDPLAEVFGEAAGRPASWGRMEERLQMVQGEDLDRVSIDEETLRRPRSIDR